MSMNLNTGADLRRWRVESKLSQKDLAEKVGYTPQYLCSVEKSDEKLSSKLINRVEKVNIELNPISTYEEMFRVINDNLHDNVEAYKKFEKEMITIVNRKHQFANPKQTALYFEYIVVCLKKLLKLISLKTKDTEIEEHLEFVRKKAIEFRSYDRCK